MADNGMMPDWYYRHARAMHNTGRHMDYVNSILYRAWQRRLKRERNIPRFYC